MRGVRLKVQALLALNMAEARGDLCPTRLRTLTPEARTAHLCRIRGIGPWTGDRAAIFYFQEPDIWPDRDAAAGKAFRRFLREGQPVAEAAARFAPYRSFLAPHRWRLVDGAL